VINFFLNLFLLKNPMNLKTWLNFKFQSKKQQKMVFGWEFYDCEICGDSTNDHEGNVVYVYGDDKNVTFSYDCCKECVDLFGEITGAQEIEGGIREYNITKQFIDSMIKEIDRKIADLQHKKTRLLSVAPEED
jgi:hypothetical protein